MDFPQPSIPSSVMNLPRMLLLMVCGRGAGARQIAFHRRIVLGERRREIVAAVGLTGRHEE